MTDVAVDGRFLVASIQSSPGCEVHTSPCTALVRGPSCLQSQRGPQQLRHGRPVGARASVSDATSPRAEPLTLTPGSIGFVLIESPVDSICVQARLSEDPFVASESSVGGLHFCGRVLCGALCLRTVSARKRVMLVSWYCRAVAMISQCYYITVRVSCYYHAVAMILTCCRQAIYLHTQAIYLHKQTCYIYIYIDIVC